MTVAPSVVVAARYTEEDMRSLVDDDIVDPQVEVSLTSMQSEVSRALQQREFPSIAIATQQLGRVDYILETAVKLARQMEEDGEDLWHSADVFVTRPGEEALVSELRSQAAWCDQRRAQAHALAADAQALRHRYLSLSLRTAAVITLDGAAAATSEFQQHVPMEVDGGGVPHTDDAARVDNLMSLPMSYLHLGN
ncbi:hypothetical protein D1007_48755 [Hordeum vulgare]|nr:hypothetical protein D1007_48755 [Hordeum vulgare]KAI5009847.1 hypothetical protein ZWY2020_011984 [Hordeum vulgare]